MTVDPRLDENADLRRRLEEAEETIRAIRSGAVDAVVVEQQDGHRVYTLEGADRPYRLMVEQMQQGAATLYDDGTIAFCNQRLADLVDVPRDALIGIPLASFVAAEDREIYDMLLREGKREASQGEAHLRRSNGLSIPVDLTFNLLPPDCNAAVGVLVTNLTAQRHHESLAVAHAALREADERLREADRRKSEFLATLSHELRGPLAPLSNILEVLKRSGGDPAVAPGALATMDRQLGQMVRLVDDLLDVNRISQGKFELRRTRVELSGVIERAVEACTPMIESGGHAVRISLPPEPVFVEADSARLVQIYGNLLHNACKYMETGGVIDVNVAVQGEAVITTIRDSGIGIPTANLHSIFEMFSQVEGALERAQGGLGIGLTLVRRLVEMHGGTVEARSDGPGQGSEFTVTLPVMKERRKHARLDRAAKSPSSAGGHRILVVDDNRDSAASLAMLLGMYGNVTFTAHDGLAALEKAEQLRPDVIVLDIGLPKMNGYEVCRRIRETPWGSEIRIVALTGWGNEEDRRRTTEAQFDHHLVKPVDTAALLALFANWERMAVAQ